MRATDHNYQFKMLVDDIHKKHNITLYVAIFLDKDTIGISYLEALDTLAYRKLLLVKARLTSIYVTDSLNSKDKPDMITM